MNKIEYISTISKEKIRQIPLTCPRPVQVRCEVRVGNLVSPLSIAFNHNMTGLDK